LSQLLPKSVPFDPLAFGLDIARRYGDLAYYHLGPLHVYQVNHLDLARQILVEHAERFHKPRLLTHAFRPHDDAFDCALAVLTIHHWSLVREGLSELRRVARKTVILSWDQEVWERFWLFDYCPDLRAQDRQRAVAISTIADVLGFCHVIPVPIPNDCLDGFQGRFWKRPAAYLDSEVRGKMSGFAQAPRHSYEDGLARLAADLSDGTWQREHAALMERDAMDVGYRLVIADRSSQ
jgi:hypothetical protein